MDEFKKEFRQQGIETIDRALEYYEMDGNEEVIKSLENSPQEIWPYILYGFKDT